MIRQTIHPRDEQHWLALRCQDLTSTDIPALFGLSPYKTKFELWHEKRSGERAPFTENERVTWGKRLESSIAHGIADDRDWRVRPMKEYTRISGARLGASFDFRVGSFVDDCGEWLDHDSDAILEIKAVDWLQFRNGWLIDGDYIEAPAHIELQVQHQLLVSGLRRAYIGVLVGGNDVRVLERQADEPTHAAILAEAARFWASIDANEPPEPVMPDDAAAVIRLNQYAEPGKLLDARGDDHADLRQLIVEHHRLGKEEKDINNLREVLRADILRKIGDAEKVLVDGFTVSAGLVGPAAVSYERDGYRGLRAYPVKPAKP